MHIFLLGGSGPTGHLVLAKLLKAGHQVTALARNPASLQAPESPLLHRLTGDVTRPASYQQALHGTDAVISVLGNGSSNKPTTLYSAGGQALINAMRQAGVNKLITVSSGGVQQDDPIIQNSFFYKYIGLWWLRHVYTDLKKWEAILAQSMDIAWICVRPTYLTNGSYTGNYRVQDTYAPQGGWKISRADLADFITKQLDSDQFIHKKPVIAY